MEKPKADRSKKESVVHWWTRHTKSVILPGMGGFTLYDLLDLFYIGIVKGTFSTRASAISFDFFLAFFPFLLFILNLIPFITFIEDFRLEFLVFMDSLLPPETTDFFNDIFLDIAAKKRTGLLSVVFLVSIFLTANGVNAIFTGFEYSYHTRIKRSIIRQYAIAMGVAIILAVMLLATVTITIYLTYLMEDLKNAGVFSDTVRWASLGRYIMFVVFVYVGVATLYYFGTKEGKLAKFFSAGALVSTLLIVLTTFLFALYIQNFSNYNEIYGSIGALLILMVYIWINSNILLLGFELNASLTKLKHN